MAVIMFYINLARDLALSIVLLEPAPDSEIFFIELAYPRYESIARPVG
jgi:hypothetical protein